MSTQRKVSLSTNHFRTEEAQANGAISPGHLVELASTGKIQVHATAGGSAERAFALEAEESGGAIGTAYSDGDQVKYGIFPAGSIVVGRLYDGENAAIGNKLESQGDGTLRVVDTDASAGEIIPGSIVGVALEAVDMSDSSGADPDPYIKIRIF